MSVAARRAARDAALVGLVAVVAHARTLAFGFTGLDDRDLLVDDQAFLAHPSALWRVFERSYMHVVDPGHAYYRPMVTWTYALDAQWSGVRPFGYHLTNVVLWAGAAVLLWALLRQLGCGVAALVAALVFAVHPTLVPAVAWIPGRNDALLAVFALGSWLALSRGRAALHLLLFALALLTKETAFALPLVWAAHMLLVGPAPGRRALLGHVASWGALAGARLLLYPPHGAITPSNLPQLAGGLGQLLLPVNPSPIAVAGDVPVWPGVLAAAALFLAAWRIPGVRRGVAGLGAIAFVVCLVPALLLPGSLVLANRLVLPGVGLLILCAELLRALAPAPRTLATFAGVAVAVLALFAEAYESAFIDDRAFARQAADASPHSALAHFCLGQSYQREGEDDRALVEYRTALSLGPAEVVHNDIAVIYMRRAMWPEAEAELREELAIDPRFARAFLNLAMVLRRENRGEEACDAARSAASLQPDDGATQAEIARDCARP